MRKILNFKNLQNLISKFTLFDYLSLLLAIAVIIAIGFFFFRQSEWVKVEVKVAPNDIFLEKKAPYWIAESLTIGESEKDGIGRDVVKVKNVKVFERTGSQNDIYLELEIKALKDERKQQYLFKGKPLAIGSSVELRFSKVLVSGLVTFINGVPDKRIKEIKKVELRIVNFSSVFPETLGSQPWVDEAIKSGDKVKDFQGNVIAEILDKKTKPAQKIVVTADGRTLISHDPIKKDIFIVAKLMTIKHNGINYFLEDKKVKVDEIIPLFLTNIDIDCTITKILE